MKKKSLIVMGCMLLVSYFAWAQLAQPLGYQNVNYIPAKKECFQGQGAVKWKYCIHAPATGVTNGDLAYLLHGINRDEQTWNDSKYYTTMIQKYWQEREIVPPTIVTVSFGPVWLLTEKGKKERSGLLSFFTDHVLKEVESKTGAPKRRIVFGDSMGGLNSLQLGLKKPELFQKVAASCPPIYKISPFSTFAELQQFVKRTGADPKTIFGVVQLAKIFVADEAEWKKFSPLQLIENLDAKSAPEFYLSCGLYDAYGNFEGNDALRLRAQEMGSEWVWRPLFGGHCVNDIVSLADFLVR